MVERMIKQPDGKVHQFGDDFMGVMGGRFPHPTSTAHPTTKFVVVIIIRLS